MGRASKISRRPKLQSIVEPISSPESAHGITSLTELDGQMRFALGQDLVPVHHSVRAGSGKDSAIRVTSGPHGAGSLGSVALSLSLASRLQKKTAKLGSTLFRLSWKQSVTPSGRRLYQLVASAHRTCVNEFTSWPTPTALSFANSRQPGMNQFVKSCEKLAGWPTPNGDDANNSTRSSGEYQSLTRKARLASWVSPAARDHKDSPGMATQKKNRDGSTRHRLDHLPRQAHLAQLTDSGPTPTGSTAATTRTGQLRPEHSLWLMGLPPDVWVSCAERAMQSSRPRRRHSSNRSSK